MDEKAVSGNNFIHRLKSSSPLKILIVVLVISVLVGSGSGYFLASSQSSAVSGLPLIEQKPKSAAQDNQTFRDFAEGKLTKKPEAKNGAVSEGTHLLIRDGAVPVALTSSVVDLSEFENKKVKVYGETQKAIKEGWFMDVGKVEEVK